jgi:NhaA family Na+:H+ antiporter
MLRIEHALQPWVAWVVIPVFALANAGVRIEGDIVGTLMEPIPFAIILGLVLGKQIGITLGAFAAVRLGLASLPAGVTWRQVYGAACVCGIGFTMSLFVGTLAYGEGSAELALAKIGVLVASAIAAAAGLAVVGSSSGGRA